MAARRFAAASNTSLLFLTLAKEPRSGGEARSVMPYPRVPQITMSLRGRCAVLWLTVAIKAR